MCYNSLFQVNMNYKIFLAHYKEQYRLSRYLASIHRDWKVRLPKFKVVDFFQSNETQKHIGWVTWLLFFSPSRRRVQSISVRN